MAGKNGRHPPEPPPQPNSREPEWFQKKSASTALTVTRGRPFSRGGDARQGRGPKRGRGGRPTSEFYQWLRSVVYDPRVRARYALILTDCPDPAMFLAALEVGLKYLPAALRGEFDAPGDETTEPVTPEFRLETGTSS